MQLNEKKFSLQRSTDLKTFKLYSVLTFRRNRQQKAFNYLPAGGAIHKQGARLPARAVTLSNVWFRFMEYGF